MSISRRRFFSLALGAGGLAALGAYRSSRSGAAESQPSRFERTAYALGTHVSIEVYHAERSLAERAVDAAFVELDEIENALSLYRPHSQVCRLNRDGILRDPHPRFLEVLCCALDVSRCSKGAFDVTVQPLWELYHASRKKGGLPEKSDVAAAREKVDYRKLEVSARAVRFAEPGMALTLNGIAQGYAADRVAAVLREHGIGHALVNTGEIGALGAKPSSEPWTVGIQDPRNADAYAALANLNGLFLSTSGDYSTAFSLDRVYNHIFDPHTGVSPRHFSSVTVVAATGMLADAFSTAFFVLGPGRSRRLLADTPGVSAYFIDKQDRAGCSTGFPLVTATGGRP